MPLPIPPSYVGGREAMQAFIKKNLNYPEKAKAAGVKGTVLVAFTVKSTGEITDIHLLRTLGYNCDAEAMRVVNLMPNWNPAKQNGEAIEMRFMIEVEFGN